MAGPGYPKSGATRKVDPKKHKSEENDVSREEGRIRMGR